MKTAVIEGYESEDGRVVSPLIWNQGQGQYEFTITWPAVRDAVLPGADDDEAEGDAEVQAWYAKAQRLDLQPLIAQTCQQIARKAEDSPLWHPLEAWQAEPPWDPS